MDDVGNTFADATILSRFNDTDLIRRIETPDDLDIFSIVLEAGQTIELILSPAVSGDPLEFGFLEVFDDQGALLDFEENLDPQDDANIVFQAPSAGTYFIAVSGDSFAGPEFGTGAYLLQARPQTPLRDPEGDGPETALFLPGFGTTTHTLVNIDDEDLFRIDVAEGERITAQIRGVGTDPLTSGTLLAGNADGVIFQQASIFSSGGSAIEFTPVGSGPFFLGVAGYNETSTTDFGSYELTFAPATAQSEPDLRTTVALVTEPGEDRRATISFSVDNLGEQVVDNVSFSIVLSDDVVISGEDLVLQRQGPITLAAESSISVTTSIEIPAEITDGVYRLGVIVDPDNMVAESRESNNTDVTEEFVYVQPGTPELIAGEFTVTAADGTPAASARFTQGDTLLTSLGLVNEAERSANAFDVRFVLQYPGTSVVTTDTVRVSGLAAFEEVTVQGAIELPDGLDFTSGIGVVSVVLDPAGTSGDESPVNNTPFPVNVEVVDLSRDDHADEASAGTPIQPGDEISGVIQAGVGAGLDEDFFSFLAIAGDRYRFTVSPDDSLTAPLPVARVDVVAGDGGRIEEGIFTGDPLVISGIAQTSGAQAVEVHGRFLAGERGFGGYTVSFDSLTSDVPDDHADAREGATQLSFNTRATGTLGDLDDVDVFAIDRSGIPPFTVMANKLTGSNGISIRVLDSFSEAPTGLRSTVLEAFSGTTVGRSYSKSLSNLFGDEPIFVEVSGTTGTYELELVTHSSFDDPRFFFDAFGFNDITGQVNDPDIFVMQDDIVRDLIRNFEFGLDQIDVSEFGAEVFEDLVISNQINGSGGTAWVNIADTSGAIQIGVRFGDGTPLDASAFTPGDFIFLPPTARTAGLRQQDGSGFNDFRGVVGSEVYLLEDDGVRDLIRAFEFGLDQIDVSTFAESMADLTITNQTRGNGSVNWVNISDDLGDIEVGIRFGDGTPLDAGAFSARDFIFSDVPLERDQVLEDLPGFTDLSAAGQRDTFIMLDDGVRDLIRGFDPARDVIDVSAFAESLDDLTIINQQRSNGSVTWVNIADFFGEVEMGLRFDSGALDGARLTADNFIFSEEPIERQPVLNVLTDTDGFTDLRATTGADLFVMQDDDVRDVIRGFQPGVDQIDLTDFNLGFFGGNIVADNILRRDGSVTFVEVFVDR
ncbi:MAG: CARDB domain-containing protein, partial [Pseudomonadota bacterium]